jgi:hypothetical protein
VTWAAGLRDDADYVPIEFSDVLAAEADSETNADD